MGRVSVGEKRGAEGEESLMAVELKRELEGRKEEL